MSDFYAKLIKVQANLNAPKGQFNKFGNYAYRSCEDIMAAVKPLLADQGLVQFVSDEIVMIGSRYYVKATVTVTDGSTSHSASALAREAEDKKGMDCSQITGAASSYARKYALNGMYNIDDTKDADTQDNRQQATQAAQTKINANAQQDKEKALRQAVEPIMGQMDEASDIDSLKKCFAVAYKMTAGTSLQSEINNKYQAIKAGFEAQNEQD